MPPPASPFDHLLAHPNTLEDLRKIEARQYAAPASGPGGVGGGGREPGGFVPAVHTAAPAGGGLQPWFRMASHTIQEQQVLVKSYQDADATKRQEMWDSPALQLYSIIFEHYRPAPAFLRDHSLPTESLTAEQVGPSGPKWSDILQSCPLSAWARTAVRLDDSRGDEQGSGTLLSEGRILTAGHVIYGPGHLFGFAMPPDTAGRAGFDRVIRGTDVGITISRCLKPQALDFNFITPADQELATLHGTDFGRLSPLEWQTTKPDYDLAGRHIAIIGHPGPPPKADRQFAYSIFGDAPMYLKRFMPGQLHPQDPTVTDPAGRLFLRHDCSTVGGASGACVIDILTSKIIGVHVSGIFADPPEDRNRAVPTWLISDALNPA